MRCSRCQFENPSGMLFCGQCGAPAQCPRCGADIPSGFRFCGRCGTSLEGSPSAADAPAQPADSAARGGIPYTPRHLADKILKGRSALEGERRHVTVLFADVAGFTSLAETLDPEKVHEIMDGCFERITAEVHRFEGTINQYTGDGVMALFGAPIAHEDSPRRAVHAALGIQRALRDYSQELMPTLGRPLQMRVGVNTGPVVVGRIGDDLRMDYTAVGDTTNLAARLQAAAQPGSVVVSEATYRLITGFFEALDLGVVPVKGHAPVQAFEVLRPRGRRARLDLAVERGLTPLVGRAREVGILVDLFRKLKAGSGQVVLVAGEAGIGKSRLLLEFRRALAEAGEEVTWLEGRCVSFGQSLPFLPLIDQLRENFRIEELDGEPEIIAKVEHGMRRMGQLDAHIPYIRNLLSVDPGDPGIAAMDAAARRKRTLDAARALCLRGAIFRPIVFVFEDLHWIDTSTEEYLRSLLDSVASARIMLVLTHRLGYRPPFGLRSFLTALTLDSLSEDDAVAMARHVLGIQHFPSELEAILTEKAEGVPLFVEEVAKTLLDLGILQRENGGYRIVRGTGAVSVPDTIQDIIMARLDRLGEQSKRTVQLASVIGRQFLHRLLERVVGLTGQLEGLLQELKALEIIYEQGLLPEPAYVFKHAVIQDVAYNSLLVQRRRELHRAVGYAIEELYADRLADHYGELAHHFLQAEEWAKAMEYSGRAGERAAASFANAEAKAHWARALAAAARLTPPPEPRALARLHEAHGAVMGVLGEYEPSVAEYARALDLARQVGDRRLETELLIARGQVFNLYHRPAQSLEHLDEALAIARELGDETLQAVCLASTVQTRGAAYGELLETEAHVDEAIRLAPAIPQPRPRAHTLAYAGLALQWRGEYDRALACLREGEELARTAHAGWVWGMAAFNLGHVNLARGAYEEALDWYRRLFEYANAAGDRFWMARAPNTLAGVYLEVGDFDEAIRLSLEGDEVAHRVFPWPEPRGHSLLKVGLAHLERGELGQAGDFVARAWALLEDDAWGRWRWHVPLLRARGELALRQGRPEDAWRDATESAALATRTGARKHLIRAQRLQGEILLAQDRPAEALAALDRSIRLAGTLGTPRELWMGHAARGRVLARLGRDSEAAESFADAARTIEEIAGRLTTAGLRRSFLGAEAVRAVDRALGRAVSDG